MEIDREMWAPAVASRKKRTMEPAPVATPATLCTLYAAAAGVATLALSVATFLTQPRRDEHYALPCVLLAIGLLLLTAAIASRGTLALGELEPGAKILILGAAALSIEIAIRLLSSKRFGGHISNFNFGSGADEHNRAFAPSFNSFGHCIQGCLSVLLVPAVELALPWTRIVSCLVAVYPTYNLVKRALDASAFAASSFSNNGAEWALGFWLGLSLGALVAARAPAPPTAREEPEIFLPRVAAGVLLCLVSLVTAVLYGVSWDNTGDRAKGEDAVDLAMLIVFLAVPLGLAAVYALYTCYSLCVLCALCALCGISDQTFDPERWEGRLFQRHNAAKRELRAARRRAGV